MPLPVPEGRGRIGDSPRSRKSGARKCAAVAAASASAREGPRDRRRLARQSVMIRAAEPQSGPEHLQRSSCTVEVSRGVAPRTEGSLVDPEDVGDHRRSGARVQGLQWARSDLLATVFEEQLEPVALERVVRGSGTRSRCSYDHARLPRASGYSSNPLRSGASLLRCGVGRRGPAKVVLASPAGTARSGSSTSTLRAGAPRVGDQRGAVPAPAVRRRRAGYHPPSHRSRRRRIRACATGYRARRRSSRRTCSGGVGGRSASPDEDSTRDAAIFRPTCWRLRPCRAAIPSTPAWYGRR